MKKPIHIFLVVCVLLTSISNGFSYSIEASEMLSGNHCMDCNHAQKPVDTNKACADGYCDLESCTFSVSMLFTYGSKGSQSVIDPSAVFYSDYRSQFKSQISIPLYRPPIA